MMSSLVGISQNTGRRGDHMILPELNNIKSNREMTDIFRGYSGNERAGDGYFASTRNLTPDYYPVLAARSPRTHIKHITKPNGLHAADGLAYVDGTDLYFEGVKVGTVEDSKKTFVRMGAYLCIFPDKVMYNTSKHGEENNELENMEFTYKTTGTLYIEPCTYDGTAISGGYPTTEPVNPADGDYWLDNGSLKQYASSAQMWMPVATAYLKLYEKINGTVNTDFGSGIDQDDVITIDGASSIGIDKEAGQIIYGAGNGNLIIAGIIAAQETISTAVTFERLIPDMDYVCEMGNRLWGCSSAKHEIYASRLGDPKNWRDYMGLDNDSYTVTIGSPGDFTGCISHRGYVLFFKETCIHRLYGNMPSNFTLSEIECRGVEKGSEKSLAIINEVLFYKARDCICAYDGSIPASVSDALGNNLYHEAVAGSYKDKYMVSMRDSDYIRHTFVYDMTNGIWMDEDTENIIEFARRDGALYYLTDNAIKLVQKEYNQEMIFPSSDILVEEENEQGVMEWVYETISPGMPKIYPAANVEGANENDISWSAETHDIGMEYPDHKYVSKIVLRLSCEKEFNVDIMYDSDGIYENILRIKGTGKRSLNIPVRTRRCDHLRLKFYGAGDFRLYSITKTVEAGSEI